MLKQSKAIVKEGPDIHDSRLWAKVWNRPIQPKLRFFCWKVIQGIVPTIDALLTRGLEINALCPVCRTINESLSYLFFHYPIALSLADVLGCSNFTESSQHPVVFW
ncbi:hypothetical protein LINGRAHAP2_LOCUS34376 [Linum grandiflorum]